MRTALQSKSVITNYKWKEREGGRKDSREREVKGAQRRKSNSVSHEDCMTKCSGRQRW